MINGILLAVALTITYTASEVTFRFLLFSKASFMERYRNPNLYTDYFSDENWWKLYQVFGAKENSVFPVPSHPLLGWEQGDFSRDTYRHHDADKVTSPRRPVLLYGDSFAHCLTPKQQCFETLLNSDKEFGQSYFFLNYGVDGYGVDQIYLLLKNSIHLYQDPFVVVGLLTYDLDRSAVSYFVRQKPYFVMTDNDLILRGLPINPDPQAYLAANPPRVVSYLYNLWLYQEGRPWRLRQYLRGTEDKRKTKELINEKLIRSMVTNLQSRHLEHVFVIFHNQMGINDETDWRDRFLVTLFEKNGIPYLSSKVIISRDMREQQKNVEDYYRPDDMHPSAYQNMVLAKELKGYIMSRNEANSRPEVAAPIHKESYGFTKNRTAQSLDRAIRTRHLPPS